MKALTLRQPWALLVAVGAKRVETRSWTTRYRGPLAIHSAAHTPLKGLLAAMAQPEVDDGLRGRDPDPQRRPCSQPLDSIDAAIYKITSGFVLATCRLVDVQPMSHLACPDCAGDGEVDKTGGFVTCDRCGGGGGVTRRERALGVYADDRYAWFLDDVVKLDEPVPAKGRLGLWEWTPTAT